MRKGETQYSDPVSVQQQTVLSTFILSDGKRWNAARLSLCPEKPEEAPGSDVIEEIFNPAEISNRLNKVS